MIWNDCVTVEAARSVARVVRGRVGGVVAILLLSLLSVGCNTDKDTAAKIARAEAIAEEHPDSALRIVRSIDAERVRGKHDRAHYQLVVAEAHYYNYLIPDRKTIAQPLFDYYIDSDNHAERARALYQYALVMQSEGEKARAMYSLLEAEESLSHINNPRLAGLVHRTKGDIYGRECLFQNALEEYQKSKECFDRAGLVYHSLYSKYYTAFCLAELRRHNEAIDLFTQLEKQADSVSYTTLKTDILIRLCLTYIEIADFENCKIAYNRITVLGTNVMANYYCIGSILSAYEGNFTQADSLYLLASQEAVKSPMNIKYTQFRILLFKRDYEKALDTYLECINLQDENVLNALNNSVLQSQVDLLSGQVESAKELQIKTRHINYLLILLILGIASSVAYYIINRQQKHQAEIKRYIDIIADMELMRKDNSSNDTLNSTIDRLYRSSLDEINELCEIYYEQSDSSRLASKIFAQVESNIERLKSDRKRIEELESAVNLSNYDIMSKLRKQCPKLNEREMRIALYSYAGFSNRAISLLVDVNSETLPKIKYKIREEIKRSNAVDCDMLIAPLLQRKY